MYLIFLFLTSDILVQVMQHEGVDLVLAWVYLGKVHLQAPQDLGVGKVEAE